MSRHVLVACFISSACSLLVKHAEVSEFDLNKNPPNEWDLNEYPTSEWDLNTVPDDEDIPSESGPSAPESGSSASGSGASPSNPQNNKEMTAIIKKTESKVKRLHKLLNLHPNNENALSSSEKESEIQSILEQIQTTSNTLSDFVHSNHYRSSPKVPKVYQTLEGHKQIFQQKLSEL